METQKPRASFVELEAYPQIQIWRSEEGKFLMRQASSFLVEASLIPLAKVYLNGENAPMSLLDSLDLSPFTLKVLKAINQIPFGAVATYTSLAKHIGSPKGQRAVGHACASNPFPLFVPCHRVVGKQGLGGFLFGTKMKQDLIDYEEKMVSKLHL